MASIERDTGGATAAGLFSYFPIYVVKDLENNDSNR